MMYAPLHQSIVALATGTPRLKHREEFRSHMAEDPPSKPGAFWSDVMANPEKAAVLAQKIADVVVGSIVKLNEAENRHQRKLAYLVGYLLSLIIAAGAVLTAM